MTLSRSKCVNIIRTSLLNTISEHRDLKDLKVHVGMNASNLFISYSDRKEALSRSNETKTYTYPVWDHLTYNDALNQGMGGFSYDTNKINDLSHSALYEKILKLIPAADRNDVNMECGRTAVREREGEQGGRSAKTPRNCNNNINNNNNNNSPIFSSGDPGPSGVNRGRNN